MSVPCILYLFKTWSCFTSDRLGYSFSAFPKDAGGGRGSLVVQVMTLDLVQAMSSVTGAARNLQCE